MFPGFEPDPAVIICDGCLCEREGAALFDPGCKARACVLGRGLRFCGDCDSYPCAIFPAEPDEDEVRRKIEVEKQWTWEDEALMAAHACRRNMDEYRRNAMNSTIKIALASKPFINGDTQANLQTMLNTMAEAAQSGAELVCFSEAFLQGFDGLTWQWKRDKDIAVTQESEPILRLREASRGLGVDVAFGYIERVEDALYSSYMVIQRGEVLHNFRRVSRGWKEYNRTDEHYREGRGAQVFEYHGKTVTIALCGDLYDQREAFCLGADVLLWPIYRDCPLDAWANDVTKEYAEQCCGVAPVTCMVNAICPPEGHGGCWLFEQGEVKAQLAPGNAGLLLVEV